MAVVLGASWQVLGLSKSHWDSRAVGVQRKDCVESPSVIWRLLSAILATPEADAGRSLVLEFKGSSSNLVRPCLQIKHKNRAEDGFNGKALA